MKNYLILIIFMCLVAAESFAATCSSISRTNVSANSVLTSTEYNTSLNTAYTAINALDLGCASAGSLDDTSTLDSTEFNALLNGVKEGCNVSSTDSNTLSVDRCMLAVNGSYVKTTSATTVTWGCSSCTAEAAATIYYLYAKTGSEGSTLNLLISSSAPNADGYNGSGDRVLALFVNNLASDLESILNATSGNKFEDSWVVDVNVGGANPSLGTGAVSSYSEITSSSLSMTLNGSSINARVPCSTTNGPTGLTCSVGNESLGVSFILPKAGVIEVCAQFPHSATIDQAEAVTTVFQLVETPTNAQTISLNGFSRNQSSIELTSSGTNTVTKSNPITLCSTFTMTSAGQKAFRVFYEQVVGGTPNENVLPLDKDATVGQREANITVRPLY